MLAVVRMFVLFVYCNLFHPQRKNQTAKAMNLGLVLKVDVHTTFFHRQLNFSKSVRKSCLFSHKRSLTRPTFPHMDSESCLIFKKVVYFLDKNQTDLHIVELYTTIKKCKLFEY